VGILQQTHGANNVDLHIGMTTTPTGNWSIYNDSSYNNVFAGNLRVGGTTAPTVTLDVTGDAAITGQLTVASGLEADGISVGGNLIQFDNSAGDKLIQTSSHGSDN